MNELSLFSGAGGGCLASKLLGWRTVGYVEWEDYPQQVLAARIADGYLDNAPIFGNICTFLDDGYARAYQGLVDVVSGGFPCQPFSVAGKGLAEDDPRNMWPATLDVIRTVAPRFLLLENVSGLLAHEYAKQIFGDLAEAGYDARWDCLSAAQCGAPHKRERLWIVGHAQHPGLHEAKIGTGTDARDGISQTWQEQASQPAGPGEQQSQLADSKRDWNVWRDWKLEPVEADGREYRTGKSNGSRERWPTEPGVGRVADGVANRVDRLKALGNGQVPRVAATAWETLTCG